MYGVNASKKTFKLKKAYAVNASKKTEKLKKCYVVGADKKLIKLWSGSEVNPYLLISFTSASGGWRSASAVADDFGSTDWDIRATRDSHIFTIGTTTYKSNRGRIAFCYDKYFMNYNACLMYSTDGDTWTKLGDVLFTGAFPRIMNGKLCYVGAGDNKLYIVEPNLTITKLTISATFSTQGNYNHTYVQNTFQFGGGYYYFITSSGFSYGSQAGASGGGYFTLQKCAVGSTSATAVCTFGSWSYNYSGTVTSKMERSIYGMHLCGSYMLVFASDRLYVIDLTSGTIVSETTDILNGCTNMGHHQLVTYRVNENQFMIFFNRDNRYDDKDLYLSRVVTCANDGTITIGGLGSGGWWDWSSNNGGFFDGFAPGGNIDNLNKFAGVEDRLYFMTGHRKNKLPEIAIYYSLDFGLTWTANIITMSSENTQSTTSTTYKMLSKGVPIENDYI